MRKLVVLCSLLLAGVAAAIGFTIVGNETRLVDCAAAGSSAQTITEGPNWVRTSSNEGTWLCLHPSAATCADGGHFLPTNSSFITNISTDQDSAACRSAGATGDVYITPVQ